MKPDEVMALTDEQLRIKAAELMGWARHNVLWIRPGEDVRMAASRAFAEDVRPPDYPNAIAAAWELFDRLVAVHREPTVEAMMLDGKRQYHLSVYDRKGSINFGWDESAPRAITRAFILAMTQEDG